MQNRRTTVGNTTHRFDSRPRARRWLHRAGLLTIAGIVGVVIGACGDRLSPAPRPIVAEPSRFFDEGSPEHILFSGDCVGSSQRESVVATPTGAVVLSREGTTRTTIPWDTDTWRMVGLADWDSDGKADILLAPIAAGSSFLRVISAKGVEIARIDPPDNADVAVVQDVVAHDGRLYFTAFPPDRGSPRLIGTIHRGESGGPPNHSMTIGPLPVGLHVAPGRDGAPPTVGVSTRGAGQVREGYRPQHLPHVGHAYQFCMDGTMNTASMHAVPVAPTEHGVPQPQPSTIDTVPVISSADDEVRIFRITHHLSDVYRGRAAVERVTIDGEVLKRMEGPRATAVSHQVVERGGGPALLVGWSSTGTVTLVDMDLRPVARRHLPGTVHDLHIHSERGDSAPWLVSSADRLYLLDETLRIVASAQTDGFVTQAQIVGAASDATALVAGATVYVTPLSSAGEIGALPLGSPGVPWDEKARLVEARNALRGREPPTSPPEPYVAPSRYDGATWSTIPTVPLPPAAIYLDCGDIDGDGTLDILFGRRDDPRAYTVITPSGDVRAAGRLPVIPRRVAMGTTDHKTTRGMIVATVRRHGTLGYLVVDPFSSERIDRFTWLTHGYASGLSILDARHDLLLLRLGTGYRLAPRGTYGVEPASGTLRFFRATAGFAHIAHRRDGVVFFDVFTPSNGATVDTPEGHVDRDTHAYRHIIDLSGNPTPAAGPWPDDTTFALHGGDPLDTTGGVKFSFTDVDGDGKEETFAVIAKTDEYYPGTPRVFHVFDDGTVEERYRGPENTHGYVYTSRIEGATSLVIHWPKARSVEVLDTDFTPRAAWDVTAHGRTSFFQNGPAGPVLALVRTQDRLELWNPVVDTRRTLLSAGAAELQYHLVDPDGDGYPSILMYDQTAMAVVEIDVP